MRCRVTKGNIKNCKVDAINIVFDLADITCVYATCWSWKTQFADLIFFQGLFFATEIMKSGRKQRLTVNMRAAD